MTACARLLEVEAARDGRQMLDLDHLAACASCRDELAQLEKLSASLRALAGEPVDRDALARARKAVLAGESTSPTVTFQWQRLGVAAALIAGIAGASVIARSVVHTQSAPPVASTRIQAVDEGAARWTIDSRDDSERITLSEGTLRLSVTRPANGKQVVVQVPDGTIEDIGTVFHVVVASGVTQEVRVDQGAVRLTLAGVGVIDVRAGERWSRSVLSAPAPPVAPLELPHPIDLLQAHAPLKAMPRLPVDDDSSGEDAAYLRVIRSARTGSSQEASDAAKHYLEKYPNGFRAPEVRSVIASPR